MANHPELRLGQALYTVVAVDHRFCMFDIQESEADCFYDDSKIEAFLEAVGCEKE